MAPIGNIKDNYTFQDITNITRPKAGGIGTFGKILRGMGGAASAFVPGLGGILGAFGGLTDTSEQRALLQLQVQIQNEARQFEMISNILKARHDTSMAAIRNFK